MSLFQLLALVISITAIMSVVNERLLHLPPVIGPLSSALVLSGLVVLADTFGLDIGLITAAAIIDQLDFSTMVLDGMLGFLLFAGALHVPIRLLEQQSRLVFALAVCSTLISTAVVGSLLWWLAGLAGLPLNYLQALAFGALISPTDPVAVLALLKSAGLPRRLEVIISGESLFNDAIGVILFLIIGGMAFGQEMYTVTEGLQLIAMEVGGGLLIGLALGWFAFYLLENSADGSTHILITLAVASGGYAIALLAHSSGPIAMVIAGLIVGNYGLRGSSERAERKQVDAFWSVTDDVLNAVLFVLIGLQLLILPAWIGWTLAGAAILIALFGRLIGVIIPVAVLEPHRAHYDMVFWDLVALLTWGGLRGGVSVALVLSLPAGAAQDLLLSMTFAIVLFSIIVQGLTIGRLFGKKSLRQMAQRAREL